MNVTKKLKENECRNKGITLIALVITIIVLLILAGISIAMLTGDNGILKKTTIANEETNRNQIIEEAKIDIMGKQVENSGHLSKSELIEILVKYGEILDNGETDIKDKTLLTSKEKYEIKVKEIYNGNFSDVTFTINCPKEKYGGTFEVPYGTTWEKFFSEYCPNDFYGWIYETSTGKVVMFENEPGNSFIIVSLLLNEKGDSVSKSDIIITGNYSNNNRTEALPNHAGVLSTF